MKRALRWFDYLTINIYWFALTTRSQVLAPLILPLLIQQFIGETGKGAAVGLMRLWALMVALLAQSFFGLISDKSRSRWGRRRPFIFFGTLAEVIIFIFIGFSAGLNGMTGYIVLFALYILSMFSSNTAHAATQGLIPDLVPEEKRGIFSGIKAVFDLPLPVIFVSFVIGRLISNGQMWAGIAVTIVVLIISMVLTLFVPEKPYQEPAAPIDWQPFVNLLLMTGLFTIVILGMGQALKIVSRLSGSLGQDLRHWTMILAGSFAMLTAVVLGVWVSIKTGLRQEHEQHRDFIWWVINRLAYMVGLTNLGTFAVFFFQEKFGFVAEKAAGPASQVMMFVGVFVLVLAIPTGWLSDKVSKKMLIAISGIVAAVGTLVLVVLPGMSAVYVGSALIGAASGVFYSANWALGTEIVPSKEAGRFLGISNLAGAGAGAIGAYLGGPIGDQVGYVVLFVIYAFMFLLSTISLIGIKQKK